jgi:hypothetical protein
MGELPHEKIFSVLFPERAGALRRFLEAVSPTWNVTLFHYRSTGNRESSVLLGVQARHLCLPLAGTMSNQYVHRRTGREQQSGVLVHCCASWRPLCRPLGALCYGASIALASRSQCAVRRSCLLSEAGHCCSTGFAVWYCRIGHSCYARAHL